jgi:hypothetical protein
MTVKIRQVAGYAAKNIRNFSTPLAPTFVGGGYEKIDDGGNHPLQFLGQLDVGGPMILERDIITHHPGTWKSTNFKGSDAVVSFAGFDVPKFTPKTNESVLADGTTAIARCTPNSPLFNAATFVGELRNDGLPSPVGIQTWRERTLSARAAGSEYLNVEFGWRPFVSDLQNMAKAVKKVGRHFDEFTSKSNSTIRVGHNLAATGYNQTWQDRPFVILAADSGISRRVPGSVVAQFTERSWFRGAYTYYAPRKGPLEKAVSFERNANHLLGTRLTPEVVWNLAPWSWALDWYGNVGDVMHNLSTIGHDGLVLKYGYIMCHSRNDYSIVANEGADTTAASVQRIREMKRRFPASPYFGFGAAGSLSAKQTAILAALGLTRGPK